MFARALREAARFTRALGVVYRDREGELRYWQASMILLNDDGWFLTAHHIAEDILEARQKHDAVVRTGFGGQVAGACRFSGQPELGRADTLSVSGHAGRLGRGRQEAQP